uniref:Uncharacterized protein n=1 Tax=Zooxanthella nutricula TaxID=1333877 RepID=A0A6U9EK04_9DINO|mmetsp:Transcript_105245/g.322615  ORF Transcript_105245/g.322615 Transcript_105245/m.322615 type:complete len:268 (+) Transcript_105245:94-897(+)|eukprot:CAMPEP_0198538726 /NCGR_PEP_ID=MMETSP1462-20131121/48030_1 /TAXON_ID=1333877 /ORGANISM="Brandtodinium nutriculum, Strain RCC3387" /LENGTH=267 /DNA_ID=CAMNT_0044268759 /DNA_START=89 /DNA_END=892 /DNA_ORIENTATION=-
MPSKGAKFCLNVWVHNKAAVVRSQAREQVGDNVFGDAVGRIANHFVPTEEVVQGVAEAVLGDLVPELAKKGIRATAELAFSQANFFVILVEVRSADFQRMVENGIVSRLTAQLIQCFELLPQLLRRPLLANVLCSVAEGLVPELPSEVQSDLSKRGGVEARVSAAPIADQAEALFGAVATLRQEELERKQRNILKKAARDITGEAEPTLAEVTQALARKCDSDFKRTADIVREFFTLPDCDEPVVGRSPGNAALRDSTMRQPPCKGA